MTRVTLVIVTLNSAGFVGKALDSIAALDFPTDQLRTVVVDNNSQDHIAELIQTQYPHVTVIQTGRNTGFAGGNNIGMKAYPAEYFALVNPDVVLDQAWLRVLVDALDRDPSISVAGSKVFYGDGQRLQHAGAMFRDNLLTYHIGDGEPDRGQYDSPRTVDYVIGAAMVTRRTVAESLGYLPEAYHPAYFEEAEFCYRSARCGGKVMYIPNAIAYHDERHSRSGRLTLRYVLRYHRRRYLFALRNLTTTEQQDRFRQAEQAWIAQNSPTFLARFKLRLLLTYCKVIHGSPLWRTRWLIRV
jgi:GT2 family glycosyltransferase